MDPVFLAIVALAVLAIFIAIFAVTGSSSSSDEQGERIIIIESEPLVIEDGQAESDEEYEEWPEEEVEAPPIIIDGYPEEPSAEEGPPSLGPSEDETKE